MIKYLLFSPLGPEELPTLKELTTSGKALGSPGRTAVGATMDCRQAVETLGLGLGLRLGLGLFCKGAAAARRDLSAAALGLGAGFGGPGLLPWPMSKGGIPFPRRLRMPAFPSQARPAHAQGGLLGGWGRSRAQLASPAGASVCSGRGGASGHSTVTSVGKGVLDGWSLLTQSMMCLAFVFQKSAGSGLLHLSTSAGSSCRRG